MKRPPAITGLLIGILLGGFGGYFLAREQARLALLGGPYSDNFGPARTELAQAMTKLRSGNTNLIEHLTAADGQIEKAQQWSRHFVGLEDGNPH